MVFFQNSPRWFFQNSPRCFFKIHHSDFFKIHHGDVSKFTMVKFQKSPRWIFEIHHNSSLQRPPHIHHSHKLTNAIHPQWLFVGLGLGLGRWGQGCGWSWMGVGFGLCAWVGTVAGWEWLEHTPRHCEMVAPAVGATRINQKGLWAEVWATR